jgi:hypothetical protein
MLLEVRQAVLSVFLIGAGLAVSGCTVPVAGVSGIGVDGEGNPVGYLMACHDHVDTAELAHGKDVWDGSWRSSKPITGLATVNLANPELGWSVGQHLSALAAGHSYAFYGSTTDNSWSTASIEFTLADLAQLQPGSVRYWSRGGQGGYTVGTVADFTAHACDYE